MNAVVITKICVFFVFTLNFMLIGPISTVTGSLPDPVVPNVSPMHVGIMCIPLYGHWRPLRSIGEAFTARGHHVTYFIENPLWCEEIMRRGENTTHCIIIPSHGVFRDPAFFEEMSLEPYPHKTLYAFLEETIRHHTLHLGDYLQAARKLHATHPLSILLSDVNTVVGGSVARALDIPCVLSIALTAFIYLGLNNRIPPMGSGFPARMNSAQRLQEFISMSLFFGSPPSLDGFNTQRIRYNIPPLRGWHEMGGFYDTVLIPIVWGFDIPRELCPNFHPVGLLSFKENHIPSMEKELSTFLQHCTMGAIYVNFGTLASLNSRQVDYIARALEQLPYCVIWKMKDEQKKHLPKGFFGKMKETLFIRSYFLSPIEIMRHTNLMVFISHCGDTSVHEALEAQLPIVGIPFFADQADVCQRLEEAGVGKYVGHKATFTVEDILHAIQWVIEHSDQVKDKMKRLIHISNFLGGAEKAVDIIESRYFNQLLRRNESFERCVIFNEDMELETHPVRMAQIDILFLRFLVLVPLWFVVFNCIRKMLFCFGRIMRFNRNLPPKKVPHFSVSPRPTQREKDD
ncbi:UDP-glucoronosyl and UDP-glucosyl transferase, putative [Trypanosoma cruzi marinkellei]|uniref:UDP-glucoronosyl and UDP-glucosyl transferase, putative n=1 Tax=Trypanosoma cruzi marinkellei TaxID=85056 RepID=K2MN95_TRYCR|nr:UDP-glucoronosyl and UDP-glucosyl transferase, putative [Trypanosoma cruzi marinkellei]